MFDNNKLGEIRPNQLITTFGPGSIVDAVKDSVTVLDLNYWKEKGKKIIDGRLAAYLNVDCFYMPRTSYSGDIPVVSFPYMHVCSSVKCGRIFDVRDGFDLGQLIFHEGLTAKARLHGHHQNHVALGQIGQNRLHRRARFDGQAGLAAHGPDHLQAGHGILRGVGLQMDGQPVRSSLDKPLGIADGPLDHQVHIQKQVRGFPQGLQHRDAQRNIGYKAAVHHVDMQPFRSGSLHISHVFSQSRKVSREN